MFAALAVVLWTTPNRELSAIERWGVPAIGFIGGIAGLASGLGLWLGKKWGWWLATYYYLQFVVGTAIMMSVILVTSLLVGEKLPQATSGKLLRDFFWTIAFGSLTWYMLTAKVYRYFDFRRLTRPKAFWILFGVSFAIFVLIVAATAAVFISTRGLPR